MHKISILNYYHVEFAKKIFLFLRLWSCPFKELIDEISTQGTLLDIGTGYGLLPLMLSHINERRTIVGLDPDSERIAVAKETAKKFRNLKFKVGTAERLKFREKFDVITIIDVLYLLPIEVKLKVLENAYLLLKKEGILFVKINDKSVSLFYFLTWLQELLTVHIFKKTETSYTGLHFESVNDMRKLLVKSGFNVQKIVKLPTPFPFFHPHWLLIAVK